jgi:surface antigen/endonuclease/exonuclease/phosphatase family metal-dependent hydrolase
MAVKTPNTREEEDNAYNPGELHAAEQFGAHDSIPGYDRSKDGLDDHPVSGGSADGHDGSDIDKTREEEETPNTIPYDADSGSPQTPKSGRLSLNNLKLGGLKKKGPILSIILLVLGIGLGGSTLFGPALLIVQMKEVFSNYGGSASRAAPLRYEQRLIYMINNKKVEAACKSNPSSTKCKRGTISEKDKKNYEKNGFKFNKSSDVNGRTVIREVEFPDGKKVKSGKAFNDYIKKNPAMASRAIAGHNPRTLIFNGGRFSRVVLKKFGLDKSRVRLSGEEDKDRKESFNEKLKVDPKESESDTKSKFKAKYEEKIKGFSSKTGITTAALGFACSAYNMARATIAIVKLENSLKFVGFAMLFLKAADQIKDQGSVDPGTIATLGGILTSYATSGPKKGLTATDSQGYKIAAYGGEGALASFSQNYLLGGSPALKTLDNTIDWLQGKLGKRNIRLGCKAAGNLAVGTAITGAICGASAGEGAIAVTVVPVAGNVVGAVVGFVGCLAANIAGGFAASWVIGKIIDKVIPIAVKALRDAPISADIGGVDAGNAIAAGAGVLLATTSLSRGMKPANKADVKAFEVATTGSEKLYDDIAKYDAQKTPFDVYNQYSFLGSLVRSSGISYSQDSSLANNLQNIGTLMGSAVRVTPGALALASMPLPIKDEDLSHCPDKGMVEIGVDCDRMGQMQLTLSNTELHMSNEKNIDYMESHDYVDDTGTINEGNDYAKFVQYCTEQREYLMGSDGAPVEEADEWTSGEKCTEDSTMLSNFRVYYYDQGDVDDSDYNTGTSATSPSGPGSQFRIASFNMRGASHTDGPGRDEPTTSTSTWKNRAKLSLSTITTNNFDIIGFQEFEPKQREYIKNGLPNFKISTNGKDSDSIMWNGDKFTLVGKGTWRTKYFTSSKPVSIDEPWVKLKDNATQQEFYVLNVHDPINRGSTNGKTRYQNALKHVELIKQLQPQAPVLFTGDFNSAYSLRSPNDNAINASQLTYCVLTKDGFMNDSYDLSVSRAVKCPNKPKKGTSNYIDHIYLSPEIKVTTFKSLEGGYTNNGSDHPTVYADIAIPSKDGAIDDGTSTPGGSTVGDDYAKDCSKYAYCTKQCVDFVLYRLVKHGVLPGKRGLGDGGAVVGTLKGEGFKTGSTPQINSVFSFWKTSRYVNEENKGPGHTGMVSKVNPDGSIVVEEYNYSNPKAYGVRTITKAEYQSKGYTFAYVGGSYK